MSILYTFCMEDNDSLLKLGFIVRYARTKRGLSQEDLAEKANLNVRTVGCLERGEVNIGIIHLLRIGKVLELDFGVLNDFKL